MKKRKSYLVAVACLAQLLLLGQVAQETLQASDDTSGKNFLLVSVPQKHHLDLVSLRPVILEGEIIGRLVAYDDAKTRRTADYLELYDNAGHLVAFGWFDKFGIQRTAVDRAFFEGAAKREGVFVELMDGDPI